MKWGSLLNLCAVTNIILVYSHIEYIVSQVSLYIVHLGIGMHMGTPWVEIIISKKRLFFQFRGVKNKFHHFYPLSGKNFGKISYWPPYGKNLSDAHDFAQSMLHAF